MWLECLTEWLSIICLHSVGGGGALDRDGRRACGFAAWRIENMGAPITCSSVKNPTVVYAGVGGGHFHARGRACGVEGVGDRSGGLGNGACRLAPRLRHPLPGAIY
jgi:hypothetical protein